MSLQEKIETQIIKNQLSREKTKDKKKEQARKEKQKEEDKKKKLRDERRGHMDKFIEKVRKTIESKSTVQKIEKCIRNREDCLHIATYKPNELNKRRNSENYLKTKLTPICEKYGLNVRIDTYKLWLNPYVNRKSDHRYQVSNSDGGFHYKLIAYSYYEVYISWAINKDFLEKITYKCHRQKIDDNEFIRNFSHYLFKMNFSKEEDIKEWIKDKDKNIVEKHVKLWDLEKIPSDEQRQFIRRGVRVLLTFKD